MVTLTGKYTVDLDHARALVKDVDRWDAAIEALLQEGTFSGSGHLENITTGDRFDMVVCPLTNIYNKKGK